jgi:flagellar L-ring protein precursor FlgH
LRSSAGPRLLASVALATIATGCVENAIMQQRVPFDYGALPAPEPPGPTEGAIWPGDTRGGSFLFFDAKARSIGDLVTVRIAEDLEADSEANTELGRESSQGIRLSSDVGFQALAEKGAEKLLQLLGIGDDQSSPRTATGTSLNFIDASMASEFSGDGETERRGTFTGVITCRVVNVLPSGVYHIQGRRQIIVNHEAQWITLEALVRREDIGIDNTVLSTKLAEAKLSFDGIGVIDDKQRPGLVARVFDWLYPF